MMATEFLEKTTTALHEFLQQRLSSDVALYTGLPDEAQLEILRTGHSQKKRFFSLLNGAPNVTAFLIPYHVARINSSRSVNRVSQEIEQGGVTKVCFTREAEGYRVKYLILSSSIVTSEGQRLLSSLISIIFDQSNFDLTKEGGSETVRLVEPTEQNDEIANQLLRQAGISLSPLYILHIELKISTTTVLARDPVVQTRQILVGRRDNEKK